MIYVHDIETYKNFFCTTAVDFNSDETFVFQISDIQSDVEKIKEFYRGKWFIGYNSLTYDDVIIASIISGKVKTPEQIYALSQSIISNQKNYYPNKPFKTIDLIRLMFAKKQRVSLKTLQVSMCYPNVRDLPYPFDSILEDYQMKEVIDYNLNDVLSTKALAKRIREAIRLRFDIKKTFGLECTNKDGMRIGVDLLFQNYCERTGIDKNVLSEMRSPRPIIHFSDCISDKVNFRSGKFNAFLSNLRKISITQTKGSFDYSVLFGGVMHVYGTGGIHSLDKPGVIQPGVDEYYIDADVTSLYPTLIISNGFYPEHLGEVYIEIYKEILEKRIEAKANSKNKSYSDEERNRFNIMQETYKLSLNGAYGNYIQEYSWLYDPLAAMRVTINGQLFLSMLSERMTLAGIKVDSVNTDGITCIVKKKDYDLYKTVCKEWEKEVGLNLEFNFYHKVIRRDVNSYLAWYSDGENPIYNNGEPYVKEKGFFLRQAILGKGYDKPIIAKALYEYFIKDVNPEVFIPSHKNIYDFCASQKIDKKFSLIWNNVPQQKTTRYYVSADPNCGYLYKKDGSKVINLLKGYGVNIFNDYVELEDYKINYSYYISKVREVINNIESKQLSLW